MPVFARGKSVFLPEHPGEVGEVGETAAECGFRDGALRAFQQLRGVFQPQPGEVGGRRNAGVFPEQPFHGLERHIVLRRDPGDLQPRIGVVRFQKADQPVQPRFSGRPRRFRTENGTGEIQQQLQEIRIHRQLEIALFLQPFPLHRQKERPDCVEGPGIQAGGSPGSGASVWGGDGVEQPADPRVRLRFFPGEQQQFRKEEHIDQFKIPAIRITVRTSGADHEEVSFAERT